MAIVDGKVTIPFAVPALASLLGVSKVAGYFRHKDLCQASSIDMWSRIKPVRHFDPGPLTAAQFAEVNFGFDLPGITTSSPQACLNLAKTNAGVWTYLKPRGRVSSSLTEWFRLRDFNGYNHNAPQPIECLGPSSPYGYRYIPIQVYDKVEEGAELTLTDFTELADGTDTGRLIGDWRLGIAWRLGASGNVQALYHSDVLDDCFAPVAGEDPMEQLQAIVSQDGSYEWCVFITDYDPSDSPDSGNSYRYVYLPGGYGTVTISGGGDTPIPPAQLSVNIDITDVTVTGTPYVSALSFDFTVTSNAEFEVQVYAYLYDSGDYPIANDYDSVDTVSTEEYVYPEITGINFLGNYEKSDLFLRFKLRYRQGSGSWTEVWYNPVTGQYTTSQPQAYDVDNIMDALDENNV